jgi:hypothetical protein
LKNLQNKEQGLSKKLIDMQMNNWYCYAFLFSLLLLLFSCTILFDLFYSIYFIYLFYLFCYIVCWVTQIICMYDDDINASIYILILNVMLKSYSLLSALCFSCPRLGGLVISLFCLFCFATRIYTVYHSSSSPAALSQNRIISPTSTSFCL